MNKSGQIKIYIYRPPRLTFTEADKNVVAICDPNSILQCAPDTREDTLHALQLVVDDECLSGHWEATTIVNKLHTQKSVGETLETAKKSV